MAVVRGILEPKGERDKRRILQIKEERERARRRPPPARRPPPPPRRTVHRTALSPRITMLPPSLPLSRSPSHRLFLAGAVEVEDDGVGELWGEACRRTVVKNVNLNGQNVIKWSKT